MMHSNDDPKNNDAIMNGDSPEEKNNDAGNDQQQGSDDTVIMTGRKNGGGVSDEIARLQEQARKEFATPPSTSDTNPQLKQKDIPDLVEIRIPKPMAPKKKPVGLFVILAVVLVIVIGYFVNDFLMEQRAINRAEVSRSSAESEPVQSPVADPKTAGTVSRGPDMSVQIPMGLLEGQFRGPVPADKAVFSEKEDGELVALADSMRVHAEIVFGIKNRTSRGVVTGLCEGNLRGFRIRSIMRSKGGAEVSRELTLWTPKKGILVIKNGMLSEARNTSFESFFQELADAGIWVSEPRHLPGNSVRARIQIKNWRSSVSNDLQIKSGGIGRISLGMNVSDIPASLPPGFYSIKKSMMDDEKFVDVYKIFNENKEQMFFLNIRNEQVQSIQILDRIFKTGTNAGINSTLGDLMIRYPEVRLDFIENGDIPFVMVPGLDAKFFLEANRIKKGSTSYPLDTQITSVFIGDL